jgi:signal transduction histidine kinase/DNA-binding response OmpR family regulator/HAMP domain-containing protein
MVHAVSDDNSVHARRLALALTAASSVAPALGLVGWLTGVTGLTSYGGRFIPIAPSTAVCFLLLALALLTVLLPPQAPAGRRAAGLAGSAVAAYGLLVAAAWLTGLSVNPDELFFPEMGSLGSHPIGRMSPVTGTLFLLSGASLAAFVRGVRRSETAERSLTLAVLGGAVVLLAGAVFSLGYTLGAPLLYESETIPLALPTALSFLLLGGALTCCAVLYSPAAGRWHRRMNDMRIGRQLRLGLGVILGFVVLLGVLAGRQSNLLWLQTKKLHDHPFQVRWATGEIKTDILSIHRELKDFCLTTDEGARETILGEIDALDARIHQRFDLVYERYLGPRSDIDEAYRAFVQWKSLRDETIRLAREGRVAEALARSKPAGSGGRHVDGILREIQEVREFAANKAGEFYRDAERLHGAIGRQLTVVVAAILLLSLTLSWYLLRAVRKPLEQLTTAAEQFRRGRMGIRSGYVSANEFGLLSAAFDAMADTVETQMRINEQAAQLAGVMLRETEAHSFCRELLKALLAHTGAQVGAVYLLNERQTEFELFESIGLAAAGRSAFSATAPEGEFGAALATGKMQRIAGIPEETRFDFATVAGTFRPREIVTIPLIWDHRAGAVLSLASVGGFSDGAMRLLEGVQDTVTARVNGVLTYRQARELAERLDRQNRELQAQKRELAAQANELTEQNVELEMQKRQLDEANRLKSAFLSNMSHELRTPLNSVIALSGVLERRLAEKIPAEEAGYLEVIERNGRQLLALINDILDLSRIEAGREEIHLGRFTLRTLVDEVVAMLAPQAREKGIALDNLVDADLPPVVSDPDKCRHILQNLVGNAVKFTEAGSVAITARQVEDALHVAVRDTGIGIAAEQLPHIFEEFRQADVGTARKYGGTGLGLAIASRYAAMLHGGITVESTPGQGSTFTLSLPLTLSLPGQEAPEVHSHAASGTSFGADATAGRGRRVLLVEDNEPAVIQLTEMLTGQGYEVQVARNGREALARLEGSLPDAAILDLMMPEIDGFEVLRQIRGAGPSAALPVLILTAKHVTREELGFLKGNHVHQLIQKGDISRTELLAALARMMPPRGGAAPDARPGLSRVAKPVVLVVEDNPDNLRTMRALLQERCTVLEAPDGQTGIEQARRHRPDLVLMDLALPVMDGFAALAALRADETLRAIPVVAVTASAMKGEREEVLARGFDGYLSKPVDERLLHEMLREMLHEDD